MTHDKQKLHSSQTKPQLRNPQANKKETSHKLKKIHTTQARKLQITS